MKDPAEPAPSTNRLTQQHTEPGTGCQSSSRRPRGTTRVNCPGSTAQEDTKGRSDGLGPPPCLSCCSPVHSACKMHQSTLFSLSLYFVSSPFFPSYFFSNLLDSLTLLTGSGQSSDLHAAGNEHIDDGAICSSWRQRPRESDSLRRSDFPLRGTIPVAHNLRKKRFTGLHFLWAQSIVSHSKAEWHGRGVQHRRSCTTHWVQEAEKREEPGTGKHFPVNTPVTPSIQPSKQHSS